MATGLIGALRVTLGIDASDFEDGVKGATKRARDLQKGFEQWGSRISTFGKVASVGLTLPFAALVREAIPAAKESREALGQVETALASMGPVAGRTSEQLQAAAKQLQNMSTFDDDDIMRNVTANLLTFGSVSGTVFDRAQQSIVDISVRMKKDLLSTTLMVGKALNDPAKGLQALRRVGIQFTQQQQDQIKAMVKAKDVAGAQAIMLKELERQFGGSAKAQRAADPAAQSIQAWRDFQEAVGGVVLKVLPPLTNFLTNLLNLFNNLSPQSQAVAVGVAAIGAALGPIMMALGPIVSGVGALIPMLVGEATAAASAATATGALDAALLPVTATVAAVAAAALAGYEAWKHWDQIGPVLASVGQAIDAVLGPQVRQMIATISTALSDLWHGPFGDDVKEVVSALGFVAKSLLEVIGPVMVGVLRGFAVAVGETFKIAGDILNAIAALLKGDFSGAWAYAKKAFTDAMNSLPNVLNGILPGATAALQALWNGVKSWLGDKMNAILDPLKAKLQQVGDWFYNLYDRVVGHSYVPDMVNEIGQHMSRLDEVMAQPAEKVTAKVSKGMSEMAKEVAQKAAEAANAAREAFQQLVQDTSAILDRLYPDQARANQFQQDLDKLTKGMKALGFSADQAADARMRLFAEYSKDTTGEDPLHPKVSIMDDFKPLDEILINGNDPWDELKKSNDDALKQMGDLTHQKTAEMAQAWADMATNAIGSLRGMVQSFKQGDILGGIEQMIDLVSQVIGAIGQIKGMGSSGGGGSGGGYTPTHGFARGGSFMVGGSGGVDSKLIQFRATPGEMVQVTHGERSTNPRSINPLFDLRGAVVTEDLLNQMKSIGEDSAQRGAVGGAAIAARNTQRQRRSQL